VLRSEDPAGFDLAEPTATCLETGDATDSIATDDAVPSNLFAYLVVARNPCGADAGTNSARVPRSVRSCP
jgi:hypothetical protein